jgi:glycerate-2-kinase
MSQAVVGILDGWPAEGIAAAPSAAIGRFPRGIRAIAGGHPLPDEGSLAAGEATGALLATAGRKDLVLVLISGGGSAMFEKPRGDVGLEDLRALNNLLLRSGLPIEDVNVIRSSISQVKAGGLVGMAGPAQTVGLILSDVPGDDLAAVASGPTVLQPDRRVKAAGLLQRAGLWAAMPQGVRRVLQEDEARRRSPRPYNLLVASNRHALDAVERVAGALGFAVDRAARPLRGEASKAGAGLARRLSRLKAPGCLLAGGETTVTVTGGGRGGRNQELALAAAVEMRGRRSAALMALATDGVDGPTDAAGAIVTGTTFDALLSHGVDVEGALRDHDSYTALQAVNALILIGPTGTNVADLVVGLRYEG